VYIIIIIIITSSSTSSSTALECPNLASSLNQVHQAASPCQPSSAL
jgi:hypothetical protein